MHRRAALLCALVAFTLVSIATPARAIKVMLDGTSWQCRRGQAEGAGDLVTPWPPQWVPGGYAYQMGATITIRIVLEAGDPPITGWKLRFARLWSLPFQTTYWNVGPSDVMPIAQTYTLPALPDYIDATQLVGDCLFYTDQPEQASAKGAGKYREIALDSNLNSRYCSTATAKVYSADVFVVLDQPQAPMANPWVGVLNYSCYWAAGCDNSDDANWWLTDTLWTKGTYNGGFWAYTTGSTDAGETFKLKSFLADTRCPWGQCNDFADFLVCMSTSVGATPAMQAQRSNSFSAPGFFFKLLTPAGGTATTGHWTYHQFGIVTSNAHDGSTNISGFGVPISWDRDTVFMPRLVDHWDPGGSWTPTPAGGFVPTVTTAP